MKKNGFTLMELLAVIIVLAVIALIATPIIFNVINDSKEKANLNSAYGLIDAGRIYHTESLLNESKRKNVENLIDIYNIVPVRGNKPKTGKLYANINGNIALSVIIDKKCYIKKFDSDLVVNDSDCNLGVISKDDIKPMVSIKIEGTKGVNDWYTSDTNAVIEVTDKESGPSKIKWCTGNDCDPNKEELKIKKSVSLEQKADNVVCAVGYDMYGNISDKECTDSIKVDKSYPLLTAKSADVTITQYDNIETTTYFNQPVYGVSGTGSISCNPVNTSELNLGKRTLNCKATGNNGLITSIDKVINVKQAATVYPFRYTGSITNFKIPRTGTYKLETWGAAGGPTGSYSGYSGAYAVSYVELSANTALKILVGSAGGQGAGGGGSFITLANNSQLSIAGGGGGAGGPTSNESVDNTPNINNYGQKTQQGGSVRDGGGTNGNGGANGITNGPGGGGGGLLSSGASGETVNGGTAFVLGGQGSIGNGESYQGAIPGNGGFGGGAGGYNNYYSGYFRGGGAGGYSGGQGGTYSPTAVKNAGGGGGGSYFVGKQSYALAGNENMPNHAGTGTMVGNSGNGYAKITYIPKTDYLYTGNVQTFIAPQDGRYKLETWGAQGGTKINYIGGKGGYSTGEVTLKKGDSVYIYVGGQGISPVTTGTTTTSGGFNGGGPSVGNLSVFRGSGGGATDIRINSGSLYSRVIVAGGGGGAWDTSKFADNINLAVGGGLTGGDSSGHGTSISGGTQISGGSNGADINGTFGNGGGTASGSTYCGGGGGWYGGAANSGGSGWIYTAGSFNAWKSGNPADASKYSLNSSYYLANSKTISGNVSMPNPSGSNNITGNNGNGYARIYLIE